MRGLIALQQGEIIKVKLQVADKDEAAAIVCKIKKVIEKGHIKIARLHKEELVFQQKKLAEKQRKAQQERQLAEELKKKQTARKAEEHCQAAPFEEVLKKAQPANRYKQAFAQYSQTAPNLPSSVPLPNPAILAPSSATVEVTVTPVSCVDCTG